MSKKIKFLKNHNDHKEGDSVEVAPELANYLIRVKAAEAYNEQDQPEEPLDKIQPEEVKEAAQPEEPKEEEKVEDPETEVKEEKAPIVTKELKTKRKTKAKA